MVPTDPAEAQKRLQETESELAELDKLHLVIKREADKWPRFWLKVRACMCVCVCARAHTGTGKWAGWRVGGQQGGRAGWVGGCTRVCVRVYWVCYVLRGEAWGPEFTARPCEGQIGKNLPLDAIALLAPFPLPATPCPINSTLACVHSARMHALAPAPMTPCSLLDMIVDEAGSVSHILSIGQSGC